MARMFQIFGPAMVSVAFGRHVPTIDLSGTPLFSGQAATTFSDLGLTLDSVNVLINFRHTPVMCDAYGPLISVDQQFMLADAHIQTRLIHYDADILELCMRETCAGGADPTGVDPAGAFPFAGLPMGGGGGVAMFNKAFTPASGYHYVVLYILPSPSLPGSLPWRFPAAMLAQKPIVMPIGTKRSIVECHWYAIPYGVLSEITNTVVSGPAPFGDTNSLEIGVAASRPDAVSLGVSDQPVWLFDHFKDVATY